MKKLKKDETHPIVGEHIETFTTLRSKLYKGKMNVPGYLSFLIEEAAFIALNSGANEITAIMTLNQFMFDAIADELYAKCPHCKIKREEDLLDEDAKEIKKQGTNGSDKL